MSEEQIEKEIQEKNLNAPRLTPVSIDATVKEKTFHVFSDTCLTVCCLTLVNGFTVTGESACASPENFNAEIGKKIAFENARDKIWALEGYLLKQKLFETPDSFADRAKVEQAELRDKVDKLVAFLDTDTFKTLSVPEQELLIEQSNHMVRYLAGLDHRISCV